MVVFEFLVVLEIAAIAGIIAVAFAPAQVWAIFELKPPAWTRAARMPSAFREPEVRDNSAAQEPMPGGPNASCTLYSFGEMG